MALALIGLGSNLDDRAAAIDLAAARLTAHSQIERVRLSQVAEYPGIGGPASQPAYFNAALLVSTSLSPQALWAEMARIETDLGRTRDVRWGPRTIDLDLLLYDDQVLETPELTVPHPRLGTRRFVLEPAAEIAPQMVHPTIGWTIEQLLAHLRQHPPYLALAGPIGVGKSQFARQIVAATEELFGVGAQMVEEPIDDVLLAQFYADPAGRALATELEFLQARAPLLPQALSPARGHWIVSDFWFCQALAYGALWLKAEDRAVQRESFELLNEKLTSPKLLILLDAPAAELKRRIIARGRPYELGLSEGLLEQLRENIHRTISAVHAGPILKLSALPGTNVVDEAVAAIAGMN